MELTPVEQRVLSDLEDAAARDDPALDARLGSGPRARERWSYKVDMWIALVGLVAGIAAMLATFTWSVWPALLGVGIQGAALSVAARGVRSFSAARRAPLVNSE